MIQIILILFFNYFFTNVVTLELEGNISNYENKGLIANGEIYDVEKYPFVVCLVIKVIRKNIAEMSVCTGSLISQWFVLTAAHCTADVKTSNINVFSHLCKIKKCTLSRNVTNVYRYTTVLAANMSSAYIDTICMILKHFCQTYVC